MNLWRTGPGNARRVATRDDAHSPLLGRTIVLVTHDIDEALRLAEHLVLMDHGEVVQQGNPLTMLTRPANDFVRQFLDVVNWVCACFRYVVWRITCVAKNEQMVRHWQKR